MKIVISFLGISFLLTTFHIHTHWENNTMQSIDKQMIHFLQNYIHIDTSHPNANYTAARDLLKKQAHQDGFSHQEITLPSGNIVLVITYPGTDAMLPALALNHHMDVVPASDQAWMVSPFAGDIINNIIIGRGVQDMKGVGVVQYFALKMLHDAEIKLKRTVHLLAVPEEETGGIFGTKELVQTDTFKQLNIGFIIDEGLSSSDKQTLFIKVSERKPIKIRITVHGELAHGSKLHCYNAIHELITILHRIVSIHTEEQHKPSTPGQLLSMNITSLKAGVEKNGTIALNVVPNYAQATIDVRVPPAMSLADVQSLLDKEINSAHSSYKVESTIDDYIYNKADYKTPLYQALAGAIQKHGLQAQPHHFEATTDLVFHLGLGIEGVGFTPFTTQDNLHGINESVPIEDLIQGKNILVTFIQDFCS